MGQSCIRNLQEANYCHSLLTGNVIVALPEKQWHCQLYELDAVKWCKHSYHRGHTHTPLSNLSSCFVHYSLQGGNHFFCCGPTIVTLSTVLADCGQRILENADCLHWQWRRIANDVCIVQLLKRPPWSSMISSPSFCCPEAKEQDHTSALATAGCPVTMCYCFSTIQEKWVPCKNTESYAHSSNANWLWIRLQSYNNRKGHVSSLAYPPTAISIQTCPN